jgi:3-methyladenine DNA glycosylase AlkD
MNKAPTPPTRKSLDAGAPDSPGLSELRLDIAAVADAERAQSNSRFFKTGPGEYGEGDQFAGLTLAQVHALRRKYRALSLDVLTELLQSPIHEERLLALDILVDQYNKGDPGLRQAIYELYLHSTRWINNWDLVDCSAAYIIGAHLQSKPQDVLGRLAASESVWERRIAIIATFYFIRHGEPTPALRIAETLLQDRHDLIHKAAGWMLREVGKRCGKTHLTGFLDKYAATMPRTMLRYAIEQLPREEQQYYMGLKAMLKARPNAV